MGVIYLRTNLVNGMQYVGQSSNFKNRESNWKNKNQPYANQFLTKARNKYGLDNFKTEILIECQTEDELNNWEKYYIKSYNTLFPNGYNFQNGGKTNYNCSEKTKAKISEANKGKTPWNKGKTYEELFDEETAKKLRTIASDYAKTRTGEKNPFYQHTFKIHPMKNKHHSEETKRKISQKNKNGKLAVPIVQINSNNEIIEYPSNREASRNGYDCGSISKAVRGVCNAGHRYKGSEWYTKSDYEKMLEV